MNRDQVLAELRRHRQDIEQHFGIKHLSVFGSAARDESATSGKAGGLKKVEPLKAVDVVNRSKRFGCEPPTGGPAYHRSI